jgi:hypothetical protein
MNKWIGSITPEDVKGRSESAKQLARDRPRALKIARSIRHPWYRCQALTAVAEGESSPHVCESLLAEALSAAYEQSEPNRVVSVAAWPLHHLSIVNPAEAKIVIRRLLGIIATEPHGLRKLDGIARILCAVIGSAEMRIMIMPAFNKAMSASFGWRTERILAFSAYALAEFDSETAKKMLESRAPNKFTRQALAKLNRSCQ